MTPFSFLSGMSKTQPHFMIRYIYLPKKDKSLIPNFNMFHSLLFVVFDLKMKKKMQKTLESTKFRGCPICAVAAKPGGPEVEVM